MTITAPAHQRLWLPGRPKRRVIRQPDMRYLGKPRLSGAPLSDKEISYDELHIVRAWQAFEHSHAETVRYFMWELAQKNPGEEFGHFYKAAKFIRLRRVPRYMRQQGAGTGRPGVGQMAYLLSALREQGVLFTQMIAKTPEVPLVYCYGVQAVGDTPEEAQDAADEAHAALCGLLDGTFQQIEYTSLSMKEGESIARHSTTWQNLAVARGRPMPTSEAIGASAILDGNRTDIEQTHNQMESFLRGMSEIDTGFVLNMITVPVSVEDMTLAWRNIATRLSVTASEIHGSKSANFGVALPLAIGSGAGTGLSDSHSSSFGQGESFADGQSQSLGVTEGVSVSDSVSQSQTDGVSQSISESVSASSTAGVSESFAQGQTVGESQSAGESVSATQSESQAFGESMSASQSSGAAQGLSESFGESLSSSQSQGTSESVSQSFGLSESVSESIGVSQGASASQSAGVSQSEGASASASLSQSDGASLSSSTSLSQSLSETLSQSISLSQGSSDTNASSNTTTEGSSFGGNLQIVSPSISESVAEGLSSSLAITDSVGTGLSGGSSSSLGVGETSTSGLTQSLTAGQTTGLSSSVGQSQGLSIGETASQSQSVGQSLGQSQSIGEAAAISQSIGLSQGSSYGIGTSNSLSQSAGLSQGASFSQGLATGLSQGQSVSSGTSASQSQTHATGVSSSETTGSTRGVGASSSQSETIGVGRTAGQSLSQSETAGVSSSAGQNRAIADANMVALSRQASSTGSMGVVPTAGLSVARQTLDAGKETVAAIMRETMKRYIDGIEGGAYLYQMFLVAPDRATLAAGTALLKAAFWGPGNATERLGQPFHIISNFEDDEKQRLLVHAQAFTSDRTREPTMELIEPFLYSSFATVGELSAFVRPPVAENLGLLAVHDSAPVLAMPDDRADKEISLGYVYNGERGRLSKQRFGLDADELTHLLLAGTTGSGKTTTLMKMLSELVSVSREITVNSTDFSAPPAKKTVPASILALDWMQNMRHLGSVVDPVRIDPVTGEKTGRFQFFSVRDRSMGGFSWNPLEIPAEGMSPNEWLPLMADNMVASWNLGEFGRSLIAEYMDILYRANRLEEFVLRPEKVDSDGNIVVPAMVLDPIDPSQLPEEAFGVDEITGEQVANVYTYPPLSRLIGVQHIAIIVAAKMEEAATVEGGRAGTSVRDRLQSLWRRLQYFAPGSQMEDMITFDSNLNTHTTLGISDLVNPDLGLVSVIETDGLDLANRRFILGSVLLALYRTGLHHGEGYFNQDGKGVGLFCVLEEAHELFGSQAEDEDTFSAQTRTALYESMHRRVRALGARLIDVVQNPGDIPEAVTSNTATVMVHKVNSEADRKRVFHLLNWTNALGQQQREYRFLGELPEGHLIVRLSPKNHFLEAAPIHIKATPASLGKVTNDHLRKWSELRNPGNK